jgi:ATP-dependent protease ClpP protease subunit
VPHARFLIHGISYDVAKPARFGEKALDERVRSLKMDRENMAGVIADSTGKPLAAVQSDILEATVLNSEQALQYGLVREIRSELFEKDARIPEIA